MQIAVHIVKSELINSDKSTELCLNIYSWKEKKTAGINWTAHRIWRTIVVFFTGMSQRKNKDARILTNRVASKCHTQHQVLAMTTIDVLQHDFNMDFICLSECLTLLRRRKIHFVKFITSKIYDCTQKTIFSKLMSGMILRLWTCVNIQSNKMCMTTTWVVDREELKTLQTFTVLAISRVTLDASAWIHPRTVAYTVSIHVTVVFVSTADLYFFKRKMQIYKKTVVTKSSENWLKWVKQNHIFFDW